MDNGASSYRRFLDGDDEGIVEIIRDYKDGLTLYLNGFARDICVAEELMEETFVKLATRKPKFKGRSSFRTWLYAIGRNVAMDYLRHSARLFLRPAEELEQLAGEEESLEKSYLRTERRVLLYRALDRLKADYRQVLYLVYLEGFDNAEAAAVMHRSRRQIENLVYRAKQSLKSELEKEGFVYEEL
ncbi:MAG: RNA polymerase sigma factor [Lachnospiraceae bacterium]|nr:RNA polymerase sigma factor [Lachnospiraceae bacterium]